jgi:hypothetical protein
VQSFCIVSYVQWCCGVHLRANSGSFCAFIQFIIIPPSLAHLQIGALKVLTELTKNQRICQTVKDLGGIQNLLRLLRNTDKEVQGLAAETISNFGKTSAARKILRIHNGIMTLVCSVALSHK